MTPLEPRTPYIAAAPASFSTCMDSISFILRSSKLPCTPSTSTSGCVSPNEVIPRIKMLLLPPGTPELITVTPETCPWRALETDPVGKEFKDSVSTTVAVVDTESLNSFPTGSVSQALQGQVSGVTVISSGVPGGRSNIFIRGITSFGDTQPLVLVDGVQGSLDDLNMNDIESMQVLKDAGAAAIYGVRGSNGVIVITTKKGGEPRITYDAFYGVTTVK